MYARSSHIAPRHYTGRVAHRPHGGESLNPSAHPSDAAQAVRIDALSAITLSTRDMRVAVGFYRTLGFELKQGGEDDAFTTFACGTAFLNLIAESHGPILWWGRLIIHVSDVDAFYRNALAAGLLPSRVPEDASWGERYFHITDPDGHELSFATPLTPTQP